MIESHTCTQDCPKYLHIADGSRFIATELSSEGSNETKQEAVIEKSNIKKDFEESASGGHKEIKDKVRFDLLPTRAILELGAVYTKGAEKYNDRNWEKGLLFMKHHFGAALRHMFKWSNGVDTDEETETHHLGNAAFHLLAIVEQTKRGRKDLDDRVKITE